MRWLFLGALSLHGGCGPDGTTPSESGAAASSTAEDSATQASTSASAATDATATTEDTASLETSENGNGPDSADSDTRATDPTGATDDGSSLPDFGACDLEAFADEIVSASTKPVMDCGYVDLNDDLADWQSMQQCILAAIDAEAPFKALLQPWTIDSVAYAALVGVVDVESSFHSLSWFLDERGVAQLIDYRLSDLAPGCEVTVGDLCLYASRPLDTQFLCP